MRDRQKAVAIVTSTQASPEVAELRMLLRYLQEFRSLYEAQGIDEILTPTGRIWSLWDLEYLYAAAAKLLTPAQYRAVTLFLVHDIKESDAAELMGVSRTNPIGMYAALGLSRLVEFIHHGVVERYRFSGGRLDVPTPIAQSHHLAESIKKTTKVVLDECWQFLPTPLGQVPRIRVRSHTTSSGSLYVNPMQIMYTTYVGVIPADHHVQHQSIHPHHLACVNYDHARLVRTR